MNITTETKMYNDMNLRMMEETMNKISERVIKKDLNFYVRKILDLFA